MKKFLPLFLALVLLLSANLSVSAAVIDNGDTVAPCWEYMGSMYVDLAFHSDGTCTVVGQVERIFGLTTLLEGTLTVYEQNGTNWNYVDSISGSSTRTLTLEITLDNPVSGKNYKVVLNATAHKGTLTESDTIDKIETCP